MAAASTYDAPFTAEELGEDMLPGWVDTVPMPMSKIDSTPWSLKIFPAPARVARFCGSFFNRDWPLHTDIPPVLRATFIDMNVEPFLKSFGNFFIVKFSMSFLVAGVEVCPTTNKLHVQFYFETTKHKLNGVTFAKAVQAFTNPKQAPGNNAVWIRAATGNAAANIKYIVDPEKHLYGLYGEPMQSGEPFVYNQGQRTDAGTAIMMVQSGEMSYEDMALQNPEIFRIHWRSLQIAERKYLRTVRRPSHVQYAVVAHLASLAPVPSGSCLLLLA